MSWVPTRLGDLVEITHGWAFKSENFSIESSSLPVVVNIGNFRYEGGFRFDETQIKRYSSEYPKEYELKPGDILLAMTCQTPGGEILGIPGKIPNDGQIYLHNQRLGKLVTKDAERASNDYLYWLFLWREFNHELCATATGTKILHTAPTRIENFEFLCPSFDEQEAIAEILSSLDEQIELNRRQNRTLEAIAQALFKRWFVEFEFPDENGRPYKSSGGAMQPSELGEIPVGWVVKPLDQIADYLNGLALQKFPPEGDEYLPVIKIREMKQGVTANSDKASTKLDPKYIVDDGDVLFSWSGSLEVDIWCHGKGALNQHLFKVTSENYPKWFYYLWTKHHLRAFQAVAADKATTMGHIQRGHLSDALTVCPPDEMLPVFSDTFEPLIDKIISCRIESRTLAKLRDTLLPKLMSGELQVGEQTKPQERTG